MRTQIPLLKNQSYKSSGQIHETACGMKIYDEAIAHIANQRIEIDLDDGVKVNYAKFQGVEVAQEGKKALKVDLLAKIEIRKWGEIGVFEKNLYKEL